MPGPVDSGCILNNKIYAIINKNLLFIINSLVLNIKNNKRANFFIIEK